MNKALATLLLFFALTTAALAEPTSHTNHDIDAIWLVMAGALVFLMQAGFALIESGMSRAKNSINVIMKNYSDVCFGSAIFGLVGFGIMFGSNYNGLFGTDHFWMSGFTDYDYSLLFFQTMFAATAATIVSGAMAERTQFFPYLIGSMLIMGLIYPVFGSWSWGSLYAGSGWLKDLGFVDFAGSTVVHSIGAWCALAGIIVVGPRLGRFDRFGKARQIPGHNITLVVLGGFILWFGWFGFNGGSTLGADVSLGKIALNTQLAAACGVMGVIAALRISHKPILTHKIINGSLGGLVAVSAGCATMDPRFAMLTGLVAGIVVIISTQLLEYLQIDDVVGAVPVHGFCGVWGTLAAGAFYEGNLFDPHLILVQFVGTAVAFLWAFPMAYLAFRLIKSVTGLRSPSLHEQRGLDFSEHDEVGYPEFQKQTLHQRVGENKHD